MGVAGQRSRSLATRSPSPSPSGSGAFIAGGENPGRGNGVGEGGGAASGPVASTRTNPPRTGATCSTPPAPAGYGAAVMNGKVPDSAGPIDKPVRPKPCAGAGPGCPGPPEPVTCTPAAGVKTILAIVASPVLRTASE